MRDVKAFVRFMLDEELVERNIKVKLPKLPQTLFPVLTKDELETIWQTPQLTYPGAMGKRNRAIAGLMLDTGLRRWEVVSLTPGDINVDDQLVTAPLADSGPRDARQPAVSSRDWKTRTASHATP